MDARPQEDRGQRGGVSAHPWKGKQKKLFSLGKRLSAALQSCVWLGPMPWELCGDACSCFCRWISPSGSWISAMSWPMGSCPACLCAARVSATVGRCGRASPAVHLGSSVPSGRITAGTEPWGKQSSLLGPCRAGCRLILMGSIVVWNTCEGVLQPCGGSWSVPIEEHAEEEGKPRRWRGCCSSLSHAFCCWERWGRIPVFGKGKVQLDVANVRLSKRAGVCLTLWEGMTFHLMGQVFRDFLFPLKKILETVVLP